MVRVPTLTCAFHVRYRHTHNVCAQVSPEPNHKTEFVTIRLEPAMRAALARQARENERTLSGEVRAAVKRYLTQAEVAA